MRDRESARIARYRHGILAELFILFRARSFGSGRKSAGSKLINIAFRYDDFSANSQTELEREIIGVFQRNRASLTVAVIPFIAEGDVTDPLAQKLLPLPSEKAEILKDSFAAGVTDIALHGYSHQTNNTEYMAEFSGLDDRSQIEKLAEGAQFLESMTAAPVRVFVPPWNCYDLSTLRALEQLGFSTLSASTNGLANRSSNLKFVPATCGLTQLERGVEDARNSSDSRPLIVVMFHSFDFREFDQKRGIIAYEDFCALIQRLGSQSDVRLISITQATLSLGDLGAKRFVGQKRFSAFCSLLPSCLIAPLLRAWRKR